MYKIYFQWKEGCKPEGGYFTNYQKKLTFDECKNKAEQMLDDVASVATKVIITIQPE